MSLSALNIFATGKLVNHGGKWGLEIPEKFQFYGLENAIKLAKKIIKIGENVNETVKLCLK